MELLQNTSLISAFHGASSSLLIPTIVILVLLVVYSIYCIGSALVEFVSDRRHYRAQIPQLVAALDAAEFDEVPRVIEEAQLLRMQKDDLQELNSYLYLPPDARREVAKRLLADQEIKLNRRVMHTNIAAKIAPMLGLMGTLIPLGPGLVALGTGEIQTLSQALLVAFDTTVAGLAASVICFIVSSVRRNWYNDYLVSMEAAFNTLLEKAELDGAKGAEHGRER